MASHGQEMLVDGIGIGAEVGTDFWLNAGAESLLSCALAPAAGYVISNFVKTAISRQEQVKLNIKNGYLLLFIVEECKWQAIASVAKETQTKLDKNSERINKILRVAEHSAERIGRLCKTRKSWCGYLCTYVRPFGRQRRLIANEAGHELVVNEEILANLSCLFEQGFQQESLGDSGYTARHLLTKFGEGVLSDLYHILNRNFKLHASRLHRFDVEAESYDDINLFLTNFRSLEIGWVEKFHTLLTKEIASNKNNLFNISSLQIGADIKKTNVEIADAVGGVSRGMESLKSQITELAGYLIPELRLHPTGVAYKQLSKTFSDYMYINEASDFIGRSSEVEALFEFLESPTKVSWWQICGDGGEGKSRLALEVVRKAELKGWHAGFLVLDVLRGSIDWGSIKFTQPTLCIVDYVAHPDKTEKCSKALVDLLRRVSSVYPDWSSPVESKVRFLFIDRLPYEVSGSSAGRSVIKDAGWYRRFLRAGEPTLLENSCWRREVLSLSQLSSDDLLQIAQTSLMRHHQMALTESQSRELIRGLDRWDKTRKAARPLYVIVLAQYLSASGESDINLNVSDAFDWLLKTEFDQNPKCKNLSRWARRLAAITILIGEFDYEGLNIDRHFYGLDQGSDVLEQVWLLMGYSVAVDGDLFDGSTPIQARTPDTIAEYLLHKLSLSKDELRHVVQDAMRLSEVEFLNRFQRLLSDYESLGSAKTVRDLVSVTADLKKELLNYLLILSSQNGDADAIDCLLSDADACYTSGNGVFPLAVAAYYGYLDIVRLLISSGANAQQTLSPYGVSALYLASQNGHYETVEYLLSCQGEKDIAVRQDGVHPILAAAASDHKKIVDTFLEYDATLLNYINEVNGDSLLINAVSAGCTDVVRFLLGFEGIDVNHITRSGGFAALIAATKGYTDIVEILWQHPDIDINQANEIGGTVLFAAIERGQTEVVHLLLAGTDRATGVVDINYVCKNTGQFPLYLAVQHQHVEIIQLLVPIEGVEFNRVFVQDGYTPLGHAVYYGYIGVVGELLKRSDIEVNNFCGREEKTPLYMAVERADALSVKLLLDHKAIRVNIDGSRDQLPVLSLACIKGYKEIVEILVEHDDIDLDREDFDSRSFPLYYAVYYGHLDIVEILVTKGASLEKVNPMRGKGSLELAREMLSTATEDSEESSRRLAIFKLIDSRSKDS